MSRPRLLIVEVGVRPQVRAIPGRTALEIYLAHEITLDQRLQAIVNCCKRNCWLLSSHAGVDLVRRRMIAFSQEYIVNDLALRSGTQAAAGELFSQCEGVFGDACHVEPTNKLEWF
jgi:hypothetical protein